MNALWIFWILLGLLSLYLGYEDWCQTSLIIANIWIAILSSERRNKI